MLRMTQNRKASGARDYFATALARDDYLAQHPGRWGGMGATLLGLDGPVKRDDFLALAENRKPNGDRLTLRTNGWRKEPLLDPVTRRQKRDDRGRPEYRLVPNRRAGWDLTFSVPKSVSLHLALTGNREAEAFVQRAIEETMARIEADVLARVRKSGRDEDRRTGNLAWAWFDHHETRPVQGVPDPHRHAHVFVFNATFDGVEGRWKAVQMGQVKADLPFYEAYFHARLAEMLHSAGYGIRRTEKARHFELSGVSQELIDRFSKRTKRIEEMVRARHAHVEADARARVALTGESFDEAFAAALKRQPEALRAQIARYGAWTREPKGEAVTTDLQELRDRWRAQMSLEEAASLSRESLRAAPDQNLLRLEDARKLAQEMAPRGAPPRRLEAELLRCGIGTLPIGHSGPEGRGGSAQRGEPREAVGRHKPPSAAPAWEEEDVDLSPTRPGRSRGGPG
jgi:conjugative relaxase-like TrwC/TraI family protein